MMSATTDIRQTVQALKPGLLGRLVYTVFPLRKKIAHENVRIAFGDALSETDAKRLVQAFYRHLFRGFWENLFLGFMTEKQIKSKIRVEGMERLMKAAEANKGILLLTGHFGNWELAPMAGILHFPQFKGRLHILRRQIVNKTIEKILFRRFYQMGLDVIPKRASLSRVMDALSKNDTVAFIMDQYARPGREGIEVPFFGRPAGTFKSLAMVARTAECTVLPCASWREPDGSHIMKFFEPIPWIKDADPDQEIYLNTLEYNRRIERFILAHPDQWLWIHKRWKVKAPATRRKR